MSGLGEALVVAFAATADAGRSRAFYEDVLGLSLLEDGEHALVFAAGPTTLRVQKVAAVAPPPYTVLGWQVGDAAAVVRGLLARGARLERFDGLDQDELGMWVSPAGARVAWLRDPDGNLVSLTQPAR